MKRTVLVLGGGSGQLGLLRRLREKGVRIILQDRNPRCPGRPFADAFIEADTFDADAAASAAREYRVDGVLTAGTDQPVLAAAEAVQARGCPGLHSPDTALAVTDKEVMKTALDRAGIPVPAFGFAGPGRLPTAGDIRRQEGLRFPLVVKPVDSQGQRGVLRVDGPEDLEASCREALGYSRRGRIIFENYHLHREVTVSGWVHGGSAVIWAVTDRVTREFPPHIGLCLAHRYPSLYARGQERLIADLTRRSSAALGIENGPIYFQFLVTGSRILVNECASRLGGACEDISLPPVCGVNPVDLLITGSLEGGADPKEDRFSVPVTAASFSVPLMFCRPGRIAAMAGERRVRALPGVTAFSFLQKPGTVIHRPENSVQRAAWMVVHGKGIPDVNRILDRAASRILITDSRGRQLLRNPLGYARNENC